MKQLNQEDICTGNESATLEFWVITTENLHSDMNLTLHCSHGGIIFIL